ncbi:MAG: dihydrodipicolinate synthase family protein [Saprospiraceae bacterium]|nr:dihydrodipicolinate synthase family protein [Saprospiraceae bacterium]
MMKTNRRSFISTAIIGSIGAPLFAMDTYSKKAPRTTIAGEPFRGIFPIMQTPFREDGEIDLEVLRKEVNFIIAAGAHGMAWPQLASEFYVLSDEERLATAEVIVSEANGRLPVIIGVQSTNYWKVALKFARHAESIGADGIISLPPYMSNPTVEASVRYYETLANTVDIPVFIQNSGGRWGVTMPTDRIVALGSKFPQTFYVKEEGDPVTHRIGAMIDKGKGALQGVFSGGDGTTLLNELRRGCAGSMTGVGMVDIYAKIFNSFTAGKEKQAQEMFDKMMSFQMFKRTAGWLPTEKAVLKERGVFTNSKMRIAPYDLEWDEVDRQEFQVLFDRLKPFFEVSN